MGRWLVLGGTLAAFANAAPAPVSMRWDDLGPMIRNQRVEVRSDTGWVKGRAVRTEPDRMILENATIRRDRISEVKVVQYSGEARRLGKFLGGAVGLVGGLLGALAIGLQESPPPSMGEKAAAGALAVGGLPGGMLAGYLIGRALDRKVTLIRVIPN